MNKDINSLYEQYKSLGNPETFDEFVQLKDQAGEDVFFEFMNNYVSDSLKKKENSQETPNNSLGLGENQPIPISAQGNPQITSVPISQDLDLNQAQIEAMQGVQNPASLNLELPQQSVNQNGLLESNGEINTSSSALEDSFNNFIQQGGELPLNPTSTRLNVLPRAYEEQFNNRTTTTPQKEVAKNINTTNNDFVDFGNGITLPKELLPEDKTKEEFNKEIAESAKNVTLKQSGLLEPHDIENPKWVSRNIGNLQGEDYVNLILQREKEGKVKVARNEKGEFIDEYLKPILDNSNVLWQPVGSYINEHNNKIYKFNKEIELNNQKVSQNNSLIESQNIRDLFLGKKEETKSPLTNLYNKIYSDTGILLTEEQKAQFNSIDDVYNFYASEKAKKDVKNNPSLNYTEEYNKIINELNPKIDTQQSLQLGKNFVNNFLLGFRIEEEKSFNEARGYGAKIDPSYQKGYNSKDDLQEINFIKNLSNNQYGLGLIGEWWNAVGKNEIGTSNYKINATLSTPEGRADVINSIANYINGRGSIQKELAYENIQREKFNNLKNAKEGNALALQNSINIIQSESNKINQIDTQQKEIYDFIDSWKKTQIRNNKKEQEFSNTYSGYQNGEIVPSIKVIAGNTVNGISDAFKSTIAGVTLLPNLIIGSDEYNDVISEIKKPSDFFGVKTSGMLSKYYDYKSGGKDIRFQNGNYYELINGDYRPINLTYAQISNLGKAKEGEEFSIAGMIGDTTRMATEMALAEFTGAVALKGLSKFSQIRNIERASNVFGEESAFTNSLQRLERFSKNPTNNGYFGWYTQTIADNYLEAKAKGMTNTQAAIYGSIQSLLTSFLSRINPDVKFFRIYKEIDEKLIGSLLKNDKQGFLNNVKSISNHVGGEISSETGQELTEQFAQELVKQVYNVSLTDKKFDTMTADDVLKTVITTAITTGALTSSNLTLRGSGDNVVNYDNAYYNSTQLSEGQKLVMLANLNTSEIFKNFNNQFISDKNKLNEIEQTVKSVKTYLDKIPNKDKYTLNTQTKAVSLLYEIDQKRKELNKADESFKDDINAEINGLSNELKQLLNDDLKLQNEQPQQTTQPEPTQEATQGQTTETNLQPEQTTVAGEQGVSIDLNAKTGDTLYKPTEQTATTDIEAKKADIERRRQEELDDFNSPFNLGAKIEVKDEKGNLISNNVDKINAKYDAELKALENNTPTSETKQTTQPIETQKEELPEEEQIKINLERLNAYIEAKKQREQEQQVQVSPSEQILNTKNSLSETKDSVREKIDTFEVFSKNRYNAKFEILKIFDLIPKNLREDPFKNGSYKDAGITEDFIKSNKKEDFFKELDEIYIDNNKPSIIAEFYIKAKEDGSNPELVKAVEDLLGNVQKNEAFSGNEQVQTIEQPSETQNTPLVSESNTQQQEQKVEAPKVELQQNQTQITDNVIATIDNITLPDGESGFKVTVTDTQGNLIEDKNGDSEFEFNTQEEVDKFISQKEKGYKLSKNRVVAEKPTQVSPSSQYEGAVTYDQFGEPQQGNIYYENGVAKIKDKAGKVYSANSPLVKNLKDVDGNTIQLQKSNERLTPITKQAFDALVTKLQKAFPRFAKVTYDFEAFKKQAEKLGATFNDIQRMVMAFHGSPHSFDKFSTEFMGSGEGAQAFGWGLYFTDLESIARNYAEKLYQEKWEIDKLDVKDFENTDFDIIDTAYLLQALRKGYNKLDNTYNKSKSLSFVEERMRYSEKEIWKKVYDKIKNAKTINPIINRNLYKVSLHKGKTPDQYTWLEWDKPMSNKALDLFKKAYINEGYKIQDEDNFGYSVISKKGLNQGYFSKSETASYFYNKLSQIIGQKEASLALLEAGIDGVKYPAESISRGATSDNARGFNYVVFDENAVTIEDKIQFMQTPNGTIYGAKLPDGTIYLNPQFLNANTPIHEFSHLFEQLLPSRFKSGVELLKQTNLGKKLFEQLKQEGNYANLTDEQLWGEALNTHIGNFGENEVNNPKGKLKQLQDWIKDFFAKAGDVLGIKKLSPDTQLRMFTEGVVKDLLGGKPIVAENQVSPSEQVQYSLNENDRKAKQLEIINKTNPAPNSYNTWVRTVNDIKTPEEAFRSAFEDGAMYPDFTVDDMQNVLNTGKVIIYSSYPIKEGVFVTPSKMNAEDYAGGRGKKVYSKEIDAKDIAWIDESEGQYAPVNSSEVLAEIQAEREVIKAEAQANGTFMKAPNGKATNLNEAQWIDVRTKRFKDWFGDWEAEAILNQISNPNTANEFINNLLPTKDNSVLRLPLVQRLMLASAHNDKIFGSIIGLIPVNVMNNIVGQNISPNKIRSNPSMFINALNSPISNENILSLEKAVAIFTTKLRGFLNGGSNEISFATLNAEDFGLQIIGGLSAFEGFSNFRGSNGYIELGSTISTTKPLVSKGFGDKSGFAKFTNLFNEYLFSSHNKSFDKDNKTLSVSQVKDENGEPLVVYHGTTKYGFTEFYPNNSITDLIFFSEEKKGAEPFLLGGVLGSGIYEVFLNVRRPYNPKTIYKSTEEQQIAKRAIKGNKDGFKVADYSMYSGFAETNWAIFNPNQIKSATANVGTYSANSNDIRFSINSKTPLSVKEQTEVINDLVTNGEDSAFAKLQETNWYRGLSEEQKQNVTPTNIAETIVNAVNSNKRNLEQKVERRDAKIEKIQDKSKSELEKQKKYYTDKINDIKQKYKDALTELNIKNKTAVEKVRERLDLRRSAVNQIKQLLSDKEVGKNVTPSEVMSLVRMSELFFNARDLDKAFDKFIVRFEKVFDKAQYRNKSAEEKFNDKLSEANPLKADEKVSYRREKKSLKERMLIFKDKWFSNQGGIFKPFLEHRDRATGLANWEKRIAKNTVEKLTDEANKIGFNTDANWEIFNNALQGDKTAIAKLPETIKPYVMMMRSQIDGLSLELKKNDLVTKEQALTIEENLGKYITRGYSIFEGDTTIEKVGKKFFRMIFKKENSIASRFDSEKWADAVTIFQQNVLNEIALDNSGKYDKYDTDEKKQSFARGEGERRLLEYISELESEYKKAGSGVGADTSVLERRKEIAEPIRRLLGEYIDPRISFLLTVSRVSDLAYQRKFLSQVKEIGLGTFLFEEGDPNIPIEGYVKIASDTNGAYSPLNGLYTTKEFKDVFLGEPQKEKYEIEKLWLKLTGLVKVGKTVFSPLTQAVNFNSSFGLLINNGLILDVKQISPAFKAFADAISNGRLDNYIVRELIEENILGQSLIFNEVEKDFGINMERELIKSIRQTAGVKVAKEFVDIPFRLYKASDDFFKAFAYFSEADRYAKAYFGKKYEELTGDDRMKIRKIASEVVKNTMPNYDRVYRGANLPKEFFRNAVGNYLSFQAESIRTKINSIQYAIADLKNEKTRAVGAKRLAGIMTYNAIYGTVTTLVGKAAGMGMAGLLGFFDDEDEDEKRANFNLVVPEWARSVEKYYRREKDGTITWFAYGNANPYGIWYKTANAYFNGSSNTKGGLISVFDELLVPFLGTEMSLKWILNTFIAEKNDYGVSLITPKDKLNYSIEKLSPSIVKLIKDNFDNKKENDFELVNVLGIKKYNFNPTDQLRYKYNDYAALMSDLGGKKYTLEKQVESGKKKPEEVMDEWQDYDEKQKEYADEFRELAKAYISLGADPTIIQDKATKKFKYEINSISDWWDYITRPE